MKEVDSCASMVFHKFEPSADAATFDEGPSERTSRGRVQASVFGGGKSGEGEERVKEEGRSTS